MLKNTGYQHHLIYKNTPIILILSINCKMKQNTQREIKNIFLKKTKRNKSIVCKRKVKLHIC